MWRAEGTLDVSHYVFSRAMEAMSVCPSFCLSLASQAGDGWTAAAIHYSPLETIALGKTLSNAHKHTHIQYACMHVYTHTHIQYACMHVYTHTQTQMYAHTLTLKHTCSLLHSHTNTHTQTNKHTHTHTLTAYTHMHSCVKMCD